MFKYGYPTQTPVIPRQTDVSCKISNTRQSVSSGCSNTGIPTFFTVVVFFICPFHELFISFRNMLQVYLPNFSLLVLNQQFLIRGILVKLFLKQRPLVQEKVAAWGRWSLERKIETKICIDRETTVICKVIVYGKWSLKRVVVKRELTVSDIISLFYTGGDVVQQSGWVLALKFN